jgi:hypothetical protein
MQWDTFHESTHYDISKHLVSQQPACCRAGGNFLSTFQPLIQRVVRTKCNDPVLGAPAVMALCKYMAVSQQYCADNLQLLFTVLRKGELVCANVTGNPVSLRIAWSLKTICCCHGHFLKNLREFLR